MEEVGAQVIPPIFIHQTLASAGGGRFCETQNSAAAKKRSLTYFQGQVHHQPQPQPQPQPQNLKDWNNWNPKLWGWDSRRFLAKPLESPNNVLHHMRTEQENGGVPMALNNNNNNNNNNDVDEEDQSLQLQLGGSSSGLNSVEETVSKSSRPNKRLRSGSPSGGGGGGGGGSSSYPMCQVDNCKENLSNAKDYHRRHKVCQLHSKSTQAIVGKQMQRFCQQCSRFHPLSEFDEGKRSCRRRLAGHNRRRRKTQPEDVPSQQLLPSSYDHSDSGNLDIVKLLAVLARAQGKNDDRSAEISSVPNKDQLIQILSKINSLPLPKDFAAKCMPGSLNKNKPEQVSTETRNRSNGDASSQSTMDLLAVLSATLAASAPDALSTLSERKTESSNAQKAKLVSLNHDAGLDLLKGHCLELPSVGGESSTSYQSPLEDSDCHIQETRVKPLELFTSSAEDESPPKLASTWKYFSSDSSNPSEEMSPSASPPLVQKLFPMQTSREIGKSDNLSISRVSNTNDETNKTRGCIASLELFGGTTRGADNALLQGFSHQAGYTSSSSGSDHSPSSFNSDAQDRTGRIIFKLFDKDPSHLPGTLRTQVYNWLSHSPSEMESYIRPGCVFLSIYVSMSYAAWEQLEENLLQLVNSLVQDSGSDFWRNGRFLVCTGRQLASHKDGKIRLCKSWRTWTSPELVSVSPLAVVSGQKTSFSLRGRNLKTAGAKIHCTHMGGYISKEATVLTCQESEYDEISLDSVEIHGTVSNVLGRCFIEVENGFKGTSFPVIIADAPICKELRLLEPEIDEGAKECDTISRDPVLDFVQPRSREAVLHFLNELGWLFQRKTISSTLEGPDYKLTRFKFLFIFSIERDYCALVKTLLDILVDRSLGRDELASESLAMLSEVHLLNRAVKRRCRNMVDLLLHYSAHRNDTSKIYIFPPNLYGHGGVTPLHLAASTSSSDDMVDALTNDPQEIGLRCWNSLLDANGLSPYAYALMRNNHSYNTLVARKLADKINSQVSVSIENEIEEQGLTVEKDDKSKTKFQQRQGQGQGQISCSKCAVVAARYNRGRLGSQGLLQRPYIHSMLAIAAVCVCVCIFFRGAPNIGVVAPFKWENLDYGHI